MKKTMLLHLVVLLVLGIALAGCGSGKSSSTNQSTTTAPTTAPTNSTSGQKEAENVTLKMMHWVPFSKTVLDKFHEKYPNIKIQFEQVDSKDYNTVVLSRLAAKADLDIVGLHLGQNEFGVAAKDGTLIDITGAAYLNNINPVAVKAGTYENKTFGYTQGIYAVGAWYNKALFAKAGISAPPKTWEEFLADCEKLKQSGVAPLVIAGKDSWTTQYFITMQLSMLENQYPGTLNKLTTGEAKWTDPQMVSLSKKLEELNKKDFILKGALGTAYDQAVQAFQSGQAAMWIMGDWSLDRFPADFNKFNAGAFAPPFYDAGQTFRTQLVTDGVLSGISWSKHLDVVKKFLEFCAQPEIAKLQSADQKINSTIKGGTADFHPLAKEWAPLYEIGAPDANALITAGVNNEIAAQMQGILTGKTTADVASSLQKVQESDNKAKK